MKKNYLIAVAVALLAMPGVALAAKAKTAVDEFDGAQRVWIDPHGLECGSSMVCPLFGARWTSKRQDEAVLEVEVINAYASIQGVKLNMDGEFLDLAPLNASTPTKLSNNGFVAGAQTTRSSSRDYLISLELVQQILAAKSVKVRITTADGFIDATLSGGKKPTLGFGALQRFWDAVPYRPVPAVQAAR